MSWKRLQRDIFLSSRRLGDQQNVYSEVIIPVYNKSKSASNYVETLKLRPSSNCDGVVLEIYFDRKFQRPQELPNPLSYKVSLILINFENS